jgi:hypothetical protein
MALDSATAPALLYLLHPCRHTPFPAGMTAFMYKGAWLEGGKKALDFLIMPSMPLRKL